ncbi:hypothetical protein PHYC_02600 [Phycisphaerales bacterium]|nr:hypothetical protein PHYC_02600 [Phycisphaerales bacterium]
MNRMLISLAALSLAVAGCRNSEKAPYQAKKDTLATTTTPKDQPAGWGAGNQPDSGRREYPQIEVEYGLRNHIAVGEPAVNNGEVMTVTVPIRVLSDAGEYSRIQYQYMFFDDKGVPLRIQPDWRYVRLESRRQEFISATSSDTAASWRLRIQINR